MFTFAKSVICAFMLIGVTTDQDSVRAELALRIRMCQSCLLRFWCQQLRLYDQLQDLKPHYAKLWLKAIRKKEIQAAPHQ